MEVTAASSTRKRKYTADWAVTGSQMGRAVIENAYGERERARALRRRARGGVEAANLAVDERQLILGDVRVSRMSALRSVRGLPDRRLVNLVELLGTFARAGDGGRPGLVSAVVRVAPLPGEEKGTARATATGEGIFSLDLLATLRMKPQVRIEQAALGFGPLVMTNVRVAWAKRPTAKAAGVVLVVGMATFGVVHNVGALALAQLIFTGVHSGAVTPFAMAELAFKVVFQIVLPVAANVRELGLTGALAVATPRILQVIFLGNPVMTGYVASTAMNLPVIGAGGVGNTAWGMITGRVGVAMTADAVVSISHWAIGVVHPDLLRDEAYLADAKRRQGFEEDLRQMRAWVKKGGDPNLFYKRKMDPAFFTRAKVWASINFFVANGGVSVLVGGLWLGVLTLAENFARTAATRAAETFSLLAHVDDLINVDTVKRYFVRSVVTALRSMGSTLMRTLYVWSLDMLLYMGGVVRRGIGWVAGFRRAGSQGRTWAELWEKSGVPRAMHTPLGRIFPNNDKSWRITTQLAQINFSVAYVATYILGTVSRVSMSVLADKHVAHLDWATRNLTTENMAFTAVRARDAVARWRRDHPEPAPAVAVPAPGPYDEDEMDVGSGPDTAREFDAQTFIADFFPYLQAATIRTGDVLVSTSTGKRFTSITDDDAYGSTLLLQPADDATADPVKVNLADQPEFLEDMRVEKAGFTQEIDLQAMMMDDVLSGAGPQPAHPGLRWAMEKYIAQGKDPAPLYAYASKIMQAHAAAAHLREKFAEEETDMRTIVQNFATFRADADSITEFITTGHIQRLGADAWTQARTDFIAAAPGGAARPPGELMDDLTAIFGDPSLGFPTKTVFMEFMPTFSDERTLRGLLVGDPSLDPLFARINNAMAGFTTRVLRPPIQENKENVAHSFRGAVAFMAAHPAPTDQQRAATAMAAQAYSGLSDWNTIRASRNDRQNFETTTNAIAAAITALRTKLEEANKADVPVQLDMRTLISFREADLGLGSMGTRNVPLTAPGEAAPSTGPGDGAPGNVARETGPASGGAANVAQVGVTASATADTDLFSMLQENGMRDVVMTPELQADLAKAMAISTNQMNGLGLREMMDLANALAFAGAGDSPTINPLGVLGPEGLGNLQKAMGDMDNLIKNFDGRSPTAAGGCAFTQPFDMFQMQATVPTEAGCFKDAIAASALDGGVLSRLLSTNTVNSSAAIVSTGFGLILGMVSGPPGWAKLAMTGTSTALIRSINLVRSAWEHGLREHIIDPNPNSIYNQIRRMAERDPADIKPDEELAYMGALLVNIAVATVLVSKDPDPNLAGNMYFSRPIVGLQSAYIGVHKHNLAKYRTMDLVEALPAGAVYNESTKTLLNQLTSQSTTAFLGNTDNMKLLVESFPDVAMVAVFGAAGSSVAGKYANKLRAFIVSEPLAPPGTPPRRSLTAARAGLSVYSSQLTGLGDAQVMFTVPLVAYDTLYMIISPVLGFTVAAGTMVATNAPTIARGLATTGRVMYKGAQIANDATSTAHQLFSWIMGSN